MWTMRGSQWGRCLAAKIFSTASGREGVGAEAVDGFGGEGDGAAGAQDVGGAGDVGGVGGVETQRASFRFDNRSLGGNSTDTIVTLTRIGEGRSLLSRRILQPMKNAEIELKFRVDSLAEFEQMLPGLGFQLETARTFEANTLYDTPERLLKATRRDSAGAAVWRRVGADA